MFLNNKEFTPKLFDSFRGGYKKEDFFADALSGLTVAIVALPLAMAIAIASDVPPSAGIFTAIVAGFFISAFGGSRYQIGGPTAAFAVTVATVISKHGYDGLVLATFMAGVMLIIFGLLRGGAVIKFIPYPVLTGFTSAIALLIFFPQLKDFFGLQISSVPPDFIGRLEAYIEHLGTFNPYSVLLGLASIAVIVFFQKKFHKIPGPLIVVIVGTFAVWAFNLPVETIEARFGSLPSFLPAPSLPSFSLQKMQAVLPDAITIAVLAGVESLLSAVIADSMSGDKHKSNTELIAQGGANIASVVFGGIAATGAIARTATNIKSGAKSPLSGVFHALWLAVFMALLAPLIVKTPLAVLSAILMVIAWNMSEIKHFKSIFKAPRSDIAVLLTTFILTVTVDLNFAIQAGISLASILFIAKITEATEVKVSLPDGYDKDATSNKTIPDGVEVFEITGPIFFGIADKIKETLDIVKDRPKVLILRMRYVSVLDATGIHAIEELLGKLQKEGTSLVLSGVKENIKKALDKSGLTDGISEANIASNIDDAIVRSAEIIGEKALFCPL